jgi:hypothetical protein
VTALAPKPGQSVTVTTSPFPNTTATSTGKWFATGLAEKGPLKALRVESLADFVNKFGARVSYSSLYDAADEYFSDGGAVMYVGRVVGAGAVAASGVLKDATTGESLKVKAIGPGEYANTFKIKVTNTAGSFVIEVFNGAVLLEVSPSFTTQAAAISWAALSPYITLELGGSAEVPKTQEVTLAGGKDEKGIVNDASWRTALELFGKNLGPGQVSQVGRNTSQAYTDTLAHAAAFNRFALLDPPQSGTAATVSSAALGQRGTNDIYGMMCAPWITIPGVLPNTTRFIPPSAFVAALIARSDGEGKSPNKPAAGINGKSIRAIGLEQPPYNGGSGTEITRDEMYSNGVNLILEEEGAIMLYGWRCLTDPNGVLQDWLNAGNCRLRMAIVAKAQVIAKKFVLGEIDGAGKTFKEFEGELKAMLGEYWKIGSLYGQTPEQAFSVNVGPSINTPESIKSLEMKAAISLRMSPDAEMVTIVVSKIPITQEIP